MLAQAYMGLDRYHDASVAYQRLNAIKPNQPKVLVDYAEALALNQGAGGDFTGTPQALLDRALKLDPKEQKGLWFAGIARYNARDYAQAIGYWQRLLSVLPPKSDYVPVVKANIRKARQESAALKSAEAKVPAAGGAQLKVRVALAPSLAGRVPPGTAVFVFARAVKGPPMPLAVARLQVKDLPTTVTLSDGMAMSPSARLSNFHTVMLGARVSRSGQALPKSGDLQGSVGPIKVDNKGVTDLTIDHTVH
jgi:cytochrome c-type biogenesis protein CcmH